MHYYSYFVVCCYKLLVVLCRNTNRIRNNVVEMIEEKNNPKKFKKKKSPRQVVVWEFEVLFCQTKRNVIFNAFSHTHSSRYSYSLWSVGVDVFLLWLIF